jgi:hypothetical protein
VEPTTGELATHPPEHLIMRAHAQRFTGTLELGTRAALDADRPEASVAFATGMVRKIKAVQPLYLGSVLYERGLIDTQTLNDSLGEVARSKRPHGAVLLARRAITRADLDEALRDQMERRLALLVSLPSELSWRFYLEADGLSGYGGEDWPSVAPCIGVWRGIRDHASDAQVARATARLADHPVRVREPFNAAQYGFSGDELSLIASLREPVRASELGAEAPRRRRLAERMLYCLVIGRELDVLDSEGRTAPLRPATPAVSAARGGRAPFAQPAPGGSFSLRLPAVGVSGEYRSAAQSRSREEVTPVSLTVPAAVQREAIRRRARGIESEGYFRALGLARDATSVDVQAAYHRLAKIWHPDRLPAELRVVRGESATVFAYLTKAYQTLTNAEERAAYVRGLANEESGGSNGPTSGVMRAADPSVEFRAAEQALARGQRDRAELLARRAHEARPDDGDYAAFLVWVEALRPENHDEHSTARLIAALDDVIETHTASTRAYFYRGLLHKRANHVRLALRDFRDVLVLEPKHADAEREIRLYEMRLRNGTLTAGVRPASGETNAAARAGNGAPPRHDSVGKLIASWLKKG